MKYRLSPGLKSGQAEIAKAILIILNQKHKNMTARDESKRVIINYLVERGFRKGLSLGNEIDHVLSVEMSQRERLFRSYFGAEPHPIIFEKDYITCRPKKASVSNTAKRIEDLINPFLKKKNLESIPNRLFIRALNVMYSNPPENGFYLPADFLDELKQSVFWFLKTQESRWILYSLYEIESSLLIPINKNNNSVN